MVVEPGAVVGELRIGQDAGGGLPSFLRVHWWYGPCFCGGSARQRQPWYPQRVSRSARVPEVVLHPSVAERLLEG